MKSPRTKDVALWAALAVPAVSADAIGLNEPRPLWARFTGLAVLAVATATWRARPATAFLLVAALALTAPALFSVSYGPALATLALLLGRHGTRARPALLAFAAVWAAGTVRILVRDVDPVVEWLVLMGTLLFGVVFPWLAGRYWRQGRELAAAGWARADQLEREQRIVADRARLRERARIAQDMHDSLGHELSLIAVRAGALQVAADLPAHHRAAASDLREAAATATDRLREIIGVLRDEGDESAPLAPPGETVAQLVARAAESGLSVRYEDDGTEASDGAGRIAYRVVQEALTNAAKYAPGAPVTVTAATGTDATTTIEVTNGPPPHADSPRPAPPEGGSGLADLRARVAAGGGTLTAGPRGGGFRVRARLPESGAAPRPAAPEPVPPPPGSVLAHARRRTALTFGAAVAIGTVLVAGAFTWYAYTRTHSVLRPADYASLRVGQPQSEVAAVLPDRSVTDPPVERAPTPPPPGADCRYYRSSGELFTSLTHFRLCFDDGRLVDKTVIPKAGADRSMRREAAWAR
ncbi:sensor histidine kinase [Streptomyces flavofungini]|uniref:sensor histidine kinase n=1 Tax=Streptomyces flavofungini TaxID=68200 RepID=UPI0025B1CA74|nr:histidine kinase [Streptomyces flavofungini]WJV47026.1 histidine kinase [Streptomyces flavofungini]